MKSATASLLSSKRKPPAICAFSAAAQRIGPAGDPAARLGQRLASVEGHGGRQRLGRRLGQRLGQRSGLGSGLVPGAGQSGLAREIGLRRFLHRRTADRAGQAVERARPEAQERVLLQPAIWACCRPGCGAPHGVSARTSAGDAGDHGAQSEGGGQACSVALSDGWVSVTTSLCGVVDRDGRQCTNRAIRMMMGMGMPRNSKRSERMKTSAGAWLGLGSGVAAPAPESG